MSTVEACELAVAAAPGDVESHRALATAHRALLEGEDAEAALRGVIAAVPHAFTSLLHLGRLEEARGDRRAAVITYLRAIKTARQRGFWHAEASTPAWLRAPVQHAMRVAHDGRHAAFQELLEPHLARHGKAELARVTTGLAMYLGVRPTQIADPRQKPSFFYVPGLPIAPVLPRDALPFADAYEAHAETITREMLAVLDDLEPFHHDVPEERRAALVAGASWDAYFFYADGERFDARHAACPETSRVIDGLPLDRVREHAPEWCYSVMRPGAHILPHRGVTNSRVVLHLGLVIPPACALHLVGIQEVAWEPGRSFAFDDTYEHEAWNRSGETRVVLLGDIWNPYLREPEREVLAALIPFIGDFNRATAGR